MVKSQGPPVLLNSKIGTNYDKKEKLGSKVIF